jgi:hypothetical protein
LCCTQEVVLPCNTQASRTLRSFSSGFIYPTMHGTRGVVFRQSHFFESACRHTHPSFLPHAQVTYNTPLAQGEAQLNTLPASWWETRQGKCMNSAPICAMPLRCGTTYVVSADQGLSNCWEGEVDGLRLIASLSQR